MRAETAVLIDRFESVRADSMAQVTALEPDDYNLQAADFVSPPKWHLAHTSWFFETFVLKVYVADYQSPDDAFEVLFNSYYNGVGEQYARPHRGLLSRPTTAQVIAYREQINEDLRQLLKDEDHLDYDAITARVTLGLHHERQHQELLYTDLKYSLSFNPLYPTYHKQLDVVATAPPALEWLAFEGGLVHCGHTGQGFCFDNESPRHKVWLEPFALASHLVTNAEFQAFIDDGGYRRPELWLSDGWACVQREQWQAPLYWRGHQEFSLYGLIERDGNAPVSHISGYEADAFARWADARLPSEFEWEHAITCCGAEPETIERPFLHPRAASNTGLQQVFSDCWQWTQSNYGAYPGFDAAEGAIGEYNGKFMANQWVLRGGSCFSHPDHLRRSYRNFFYPPDRWQCTGIRLAKNT